MIHQIYAVIVLYGSPLLVNTNKVSLSLTENSRKNCPCLLDAISKTAVCKRGALRKVPSCIPNTIKRMDLSKNNIHYLTGQFQRFTDLTYLDLSYNRAFIPAEDSFKGLSHLEILFLNGTCLRDLHKSHIFLVPSNLKTLSLRDSGLSDILSRNFFIHLKKLTSLDLSCNMLFEIQDDQFIEVPNLLRLDLRDSMMPIIINRHTFRGLSRLERLDLSNCQTEFDMGVFEYLHNLTYLSISNNNIKEIPNNFFRNLSHLNHLDLSRNTGIRLHSLSFAGLSGLYYLSLEYNRFETFIPFPPDVFQPLSGLEELHIEGMCLPKNPPYYDCHTIDEQLNKLSSLKKLYLDNFVINSLGPGFKLLKMLQHLNFVSLPPGGNYCTIKSLSNETFENLKNLPVYKINLENCKVEKLMPFTFSNFKNLTSLVLDELCCSRISEINTGLEKTKILRFKMQLGCEDSNYKVVVSLLGLHRTSLRCLDISSSRIEYFECGLFKNLPKSLQDLSLQKNFIHSLPRSCDLRRLKSLKTLNLNSQSDRKLKSNYLFGQLSNKIAPVSEQHISDPVFGATFNTTNRNITSQRSSFIQFNDTSVKNICWKLPNYLKTVYISRSRLLCDTIAVVLCNSNNSLQTFSAEYQKDLKCIKSLWYIIKNLQQLERLNLNGNAIKRIPPDALTQLQNLKFLSLRENSLAILNIDLNTLVLEKLAISDNNIPFLSSKFIQTLEKIAKHSKLAIYLGGNPLVCDCERITFVAWLQNTKAIDQKDKLKCNLQNSNAKYDVSKIAILHETLKYKCTVQEVVKCCIIGFLVLSLLLSIVSLIWYKHWKIRYLLAVGRKNISPYHPIEECNINLEYDVYISYERDFNVTNDETLHELVTQKLYPRLHRRGFKVLIREEIEPGIGLYNGISRSLRKCRKVVSLISKDYCKDYWNVFEFNVAVLEGIYTKRQVIIPVALEGLGRKDLHAEIYAYLSSEPVSYYSCNVKESDLLDFLCENIRDDREIK